MAYRAQIALDLRGGSNWEAVPSGLVIVTPGSGSQYFETQSLTSGDGSPITAMGFSSVTVVSSLDMTTERTLSFHLLLVSCPWSGH